MEVYGEVSFRCDGVGVVCVVGVQVGAWDGFGAGRLVGGFLLG